ncbi:unnamed protein product [Chondrus crispus]|uniref:Uncharacterized protein n=1 Tax=Chondrus crispus TaxID=2769 RepID=R7QMD2_CHOCR|nr:unnamed protein product [Chondrus crispus]CDF38636.1 unnamed protein product [Chondrus crispus]|eukprot:XP_005718541.1 unnamed protein product [Chondrus crispus]
MSPEVSVLPSHTPARLQRILQANALLLALHAFALMAVAPSLASLLNLPSPTIVRIIGFVLALAAALLFSLALRQPFSTRTAALVAVADALAAIVVALFAARNSLLHTLEGISTAVVGVAYACFAITLAIVVTKSHRGYQQPEVIAV